MATVGQWAADAGADVLAGLGAARGPRPRGPAEEFTFRRTSALVSADTLDRVLGAWLWTKSVQAGGRLVIAVDGKAVPAKDNRISRAPRHPSPATRASNCPVR